LRLLPKVHLDFKSSAFRNDDRLKWVESDCSKNLEPDIPAS
jgi:hypothetical protein